MTAGREQDARETLRAQVVTALQSVAQGYRSSTMPGDLLRGTAGAIIDIQAAADAVLALLPSPPATTETPHRDGDAMSGATPRRDALREAIQAEREDLPQHRTEWGNGYDAGLRKAIDLLGVLDGPPDTARCVKDGCGGEVRADGPDAGWSQCQRCGEHYPWPLSVAALDGLPDTPGERRSWICGRCGGAPEIHAAVGSTCVYEPVLAAAPAPAARPAPDEGTMRWAVQKMAEHRDEAMHVDRSGWTREQWIADAERLMDDLHGSVSSLANGHVMALLDAHRATGLRGEVERLCDEATGGRPPDEWVHVDDLRAALDRTALAAPDRAEQEDGA